MKPTRMRTLAHMERLLAVGAAVGVTVGCGKENANGASRGCGKKDPNASSREGSSGYEVVDAMPPPAHCPGMAAHIAATATIEKGERWGDISLVVTLPPPDTKEDELTYVADAPVVVYGGTLLVSATSKDGGITARVGFDPGVTHVTVSVKTMCKRGPGTIMASVSWTGEANPGTKPAVTLSEY